MWQQKTWDVGYKETALLRQWQEQAQAAIHSPHRSTKDDLKILLRILSIIILHHYFYYPFTWLFVICQDTGWHNLSTHTRSWSNISSILLFNWTTKLQCTHLEWFGFSSFVLLSATPYINTYLQGKYRMKNIPMSGGFLERSSYSFDDAAGNWSQIDPRALEYGQEDES